MYNTGGIETFDWPRGRGSKNMTEPIEPPKWSGSSKDRAEEAAASFFATVLCAIFVYFFYGWGRRLFAWSDTATSLLQQNAGIVGGVLLIFLTGVCALALIGVWIWRIRSDPKPKKAEVGDVPVRIRT